MSWRWLPIVALVAACGGGGGDVVGTVECTEAAGTVLRCDVAAGERCCPAFEQASATAPCIEGQVGSACDGPEDCVGESCWASRQLRQALQRRREAFPAAADRAHRAPARGGDAAAPPQGPGHHRAQEALTGSRTKRHPSAVRISDSQLGGGETWALGIFGAACAASCEPGAQEMCQRGEDCPAEAPCCLPVRVDGVLLAFCSEGDPPSCG